MYVCVVGMCMYGPAAVSGRAQRSTRKCALLVRNLHEICSGEPAKQKKKLLTHINQTKFSVGPTKLQAATARAAAALRDDDLSGVSE